MRGYVSDMKLDWSPYVKERPPETMAEQKHKAALTVTAAAMRSKVMEMMYASDYGHPASCLGLADLFTALYFGGAMKQKPEDPLSETRDRLVVSCGHVSAIVYTALAMAGYFDEAELSRYACKDGLPGHLCRFNPFGVEVSTGSLGQGVSMAVGMAMALKNKGRKVFLLTSDGEQQEGQVWEAYLAAKKHHLSNLIIFVDCNGIQNSGSTAEIMPLGSLSKKYRSFGFNVIEQDGHDIMGILDSVERVSLEEMPGLILLKTTPGKGVSFMEGNPAWHGDLPAGPLAEQALRELAEKHRETASWQGFIGQMA